MGWAFILFTALITTSKESCNLQLRWFRAKCWRCIMQQIIKMFETAFYKWDKNLRWWPIIEGAQIHYNYEDNSKGNATLAEKKFSDVFKIVESLVLISSSSANKNFSIMTWSPFKLEIRAINTAVLQRNVISSTSKQISVVFNSFIMSFILANTWNYNWYFWCVHHSFFF